MQYFALIGSTEWLVIGAVLLLLFGGRKLPELARAMGRSITEFKGGLKDEDERKKLDPDRSGDERRDAGRSSTRDREEDEPRP